MKNLNRLQERLAPAREAWLQSQFGRAFAHGLVMDKTMRPSFVAELLGQTTKNVDLLRKHAFALLPDEHKHHLNDSILAFLPEVHQAASALPSSDGNIITVSAVFDHSLRWPLAVCQACFQSALDDSTYDDRTNRLRAGVAECIGLYAMQRRSWNHFRGEDHMLRFFPTIFPDTMRVLSGLTPNFPPYAHLAMLYMVLHEIGHLALGHFDSEAPDIMDIGDVESYILKQADIDRNKEHEADLYAWDCLLRMPLPHFHLSAVVVALFNFLKASDNAQGVIYSLEDAHPPFGRRLLALGIADSEPEPYVVQYMDSQVFCGGVPDQDELVQMLTEQCDSYSPDS
jgi:hypothetical protein